jgi:hypothetical protein
LGADSFILAGNVRTLIDVLITEVTRPPVEALAGIGGSPLLALTAVLRTGVICAKLYWHVTVLPLPRNTARALKACNQILAPPAVLAQHTFTIIDVALAEATLEAIEAVASERVFVFYAFAIVETWRRSAFQHVYAT